MKFRQKMAHFATKQAQAAIALARNAQYYTERIRPPLAKQLAQMASW
ncbi:hypothetical protein [Rhodoferax ferrireducens]|jgi:hypothetical protein